MYWIIKQDEDTMCDKGIVAAYTDLPKLISTILLTGNDFQTDIGSINLKETAASNDGIW